MLPHRHFALEGVGFGIADIAADIEQIGVAAQDLAVAKHDNAASLARPSVQKIDVNRIKCVFHNIPVVTRPLATVHYANTNYQRQRDVLKCSTPLLSAV